jgi:hypothetical protein
MMIFKAIHRDHLIFLSIAALLSIGPLRAEETRSGGLPASWFSITQSNKPSSEGGPSAVDEKDLSNRLHDESSAVTSLRELLDLCGVDQSHFRLLTDGVPWQEGEDELLQKVLYHTRRLRPQDWEDWSEGEPDLQELVRDPSEPRGKVFEILGRVRSVEVHRPVEEARERFELDEYYQCHLVLDSNDQPVTVFARTIPASWTREGRIDERAAAQAVFLKVASEDPNEPMPVFAATRIAWHPNSVLGDLGMDVGLLDRIGVAEETDGGTSSDSAQSLREKHLLTSNDTEAFYQMLAAVGRAEPGQLRQVAQDALRATGQDRYSVVPLFNQPLSQRGRLVVLTGNARRVVPVRVGDIDLQRRFGFREYYEIALFTEDSQRNPLIFCVRELPRGMPTGDGPSYSENVTVAGFFFKKWGYRVASQDPESASVSRLQLAPLLIGRRPVWHPTEQTASNAWVGLLAGGLFVAALLGIWFLLWRSSQSDKRFRKRVTGARTSRGANVSLDSLNLEPEIGPDSYSTDSSLPEQSG